MGLFSKRKVEPIEYPAVDRTVHVPASRDAVVAHLTAYSGLWSPKRAEQHEVVVGAVGGWTAIRLPGAVHPWQLHGVTVSTMAGVLVEHLDEPAQRQLEAAVAGFVAAAAIAFDRRTDTSDAPPPAIRPDLADRAGATLDDHTIKFTDACLGLAERTGSDTPLHAAERQIELTS